MKKKHRVWSSPLNIIVFILIWIFLDLGTEILCGFGSCLYVTVQHIGGSLCTFSPWQLHSKKHFFFNMLVPPHTPDKCMALFRLAVEGGEQKCTVDPCFCCPPTRPPLSCNRQRREMFTFRSCNDYKVDPTFSERWWGGSEPAKCYTCKSVQKSCKN